jgi:dTDP-4-amino-4,6-dideoxygalactose transaminase
MHGQGDNKYNNVRLGYNARLDTLQAAILLEKLKVLDDEIDKRNEIAEMYKAYLNSKIVNYAYIQEGVTPAWAQFPVVAKSGLQRQLLMNELRLNNIPVSVYYPTPLHTQLVFRQIFGKDYADCPMTEGLCTRIFSLPMHPYLTEKDIKKIAKCIF